jgi:predicted nucleic acid-binding protein
MPTRAFFDTDVLIYAFAAGDPKAAKAEEALTRGGVTSVQVFNEFTNVCRRKLDLNWDDIASRINVLESLLGIPAALTRGTHDTARSLARDHTLSFYDALIVAAAIEAKAQVLLTEDLQHGRAFGKLVIRNLFA